MRKDLISNPDSRIRFLEPITRNNELINVSTQLLNLAKLIPEVNGIFLSQMNEVNEVNDRLFAQTLCPFIWLRNRTKISDFKNEISLQHAWFLTRVGSQSYNVLTRISIFNWGWFAFSRTRRVRLAEGRAKRFTADLAQKLGSKTMLTNCQLQQSNRSKYPIKTITDFRF